MNEGISWTEAPQDGMVLISYFSMTGNQSLLRHIRQNGQVEICISLFHLGRTAMKIRIITRMKDQLEMIK